MSTMLRLCRVSDPKQNGAHLASHKRRAQFRPVAAGAEHGLRTLDDLQAEGDRPSYGSAGRLRLANQ
jgi:hypothetical protein